VFLIYYDSVHLFFVCGCSARELVNNVYTTILTVDKATVAIVIIIIIIIIIMLQVIRRKVILSSADEFEVPYKVTLNKKNKKQGNTSKMNYIVLLS